MSLRHPVFAACFALLVIAVPLAARVGTNFTYQGEVREAGTVYNGNADLRFTLYTDIGGPITVGAVAFRSDVPCSEGRFTVDLDFLAVVPAGSHIEVAVRTPHDPTDSAPYTVLAPRQPVTPAPRAGDAATLGGLDSAHFKDAGNLVSGTLPEPRLPATVARLNMANAFGNFTNSFAGRVGIGTASPPNALTVLASGYGIEHTDGTRRLATYVDGSAGWLGTITAHPLQFFTSNGGATLTVATTGRVGILNPAPNFTLDVAGSGNFGGPLTALSLAGSGAGLTALNASSLASGTVADARLSSNVALLNTPQTFSAIPAFNGGASGSTAPFSVDSTTTVSNLNADLLDGLSSAAFSAASHTHDAAALVSGTVADARLPANVARLSAVNAFAANNTFAADVGIRTSTPAAALHVNENTDITGAGGGSLIVGLTASENIRMDGNEVQAFNNTATDHLTLQASGGNLAVGAGTPTHKLYVAGDARVTGDLQIDGGIAIPSQTRYLWLGPDAFTVDVISTKWEHNHNSGGISYLELTGLVTEQFGKAGANVMLPEDAVVTELRIWVADSSTNHNCTGQLIRISPASFSGFGTPTTMATATSSGDTGDFFVAAPSYADSTIASATIDNGNYRYRLHVEASAATPGKFWFYGARITYTVTSPLP